MIADGPGGRRRTCSPAASSRRKPCHATARCAPTGTASAQASVSSPATGTSDQPGAASHDSGTAGTGSGTPVSTDVCTRPFGVSRLWKIGPSSSGTSSRSTPASRSMSSSLAVAAVASTPTIAAVRSPSRAVVSEAYVTPPPSRQPRGSSGTTSRHAEPTWTTSTRGRAMAPPKVYCRLAPTARGNRRVLLRAA